MPTYSRIAAFGHYLPSRVVTNHYFEGFLDTTHEWIASRTGIVERRYTIDGETAATMGTEAAKMAFSRSSISVDQIDAIIVATISGDMRCPATAALIQRNLGASRHIPAFDIGSACSGFVYSLVVADSLIKSGNFRAILVVGADNLSKFLDMSDKDSCILLGDGAGAAIVEAADAPGLLSSHLASDGGGADLIEFPAGGSRQPPSQVTDLGDYAFHMKGREVFTQAVQHMSAACAKVIADTQWRVEDIDWFVPHQANSRILRMVALELGLPLERVVSNIERVGNTSAASIPIALSEMQANGQLQPGQKVLISAIGGGMSWGALSFEW